MGRVHGGQGVNIDRNEISAVEQLLYREAAHLDARRWDDWLALFTEDCEYWLPAWTGEHELTSDPAKQVSLIFYNRRARLEERVSRIKSGISAASTPLPRTQHMVSNIQVEPGDGGALSVHACWQSQTYRFQETDTLYGRYEYTLVRSDAGLRIRRKKIVLVNDVINTALDIYQI
jgi:3-phenylpropionate/cinnamic acid dioxygenase small subunit